jgi:predicted GNAT family acetyltransferase
MTSPVLTVTQHRDPSEFWEAAYRFLIEAEVENGLMMRVVRGLIGDPACRSGGVFLATVDDGLRVIGAAIMTPPHPLLLSHPVVGVVEALVEAIRGAGIDLAGVLGPVAGVERFVAAWQPDAPLRMRLRLYRAVKVVPPERPASGRLRAATVHDLDLVVNWMMQFARETGVDHEAANLRDGLMASLAEERLFLWEDGECVSMAQILQGVPNATGINGVYTPENYRGRGYASAAVAELSSRQLAIGNRYCFLFADLANASTNRIYPRIGYEAVCDFHHYQLR